MIVRGEILIDPPDPLAGIGKEALPLADQNGDGLANLCIHPDQPGPERGQFFHASPDRLAGRDPVDQ